MRLAELLGLLWEDVDVASGEVHVAAPLADDGRGVGLVRKATKRSDWRDVPLTAGVITAFERQLARRSAIGRTDVGKRRAITALELGQPVF